MPEAIVSRILRLPGYGVYACEADETTGTLWLWVRQPAPEPYSVWGGCGISVRVAMTETPLSALYNSFRGGRCLTIIDTEG